MGPRIPSGAPGAGMGNANQMNRLAPNLRKQFERTNRGRPRGLRRPVPAWRWRGSQHSWDPRSKSQEIRRLVPEWAYEHWHGSSGSHVTDHTDSSGGHHNPACECREGGPVAHRVLLRRPRGTCVGLDLHRPHLVEADYDRVLRRAPVEAVDAFFFEEESGSFYSFQVRVRW